MNHIMEIKSTLLSLSSANSKKQKKIFKIAQNKKATTRSLCVYGSLKSEAKQEMTITVLSPEASRTTNEKKMLLFMKIK
jgi:hypothetical protein